MTAKNPPPPPFEAPLCAVDRCHGPMAGHAVIGHGADRHYGPCTASHSETGEPCQCPGYRPEVAA